MIGRVFSELYKAYGEQHWWSADSPFEVMVGAILIQNTNWLNVEKAIHVLKNNHALNPEVITNISDHQLDKFIHSSGFYHVKAKHLKDYCHWYLQQDGFEGLNQFDTVDLRKKLLSIHAIDNETADNILLYAFERPVFVIDENTRRLFYRLGFINGNEHYDEIRHVTEISLDMDVGLFNEYHALIVHHAKVHCRKEPLCDRCPLDDICPD